MSKPAGRRRAAARRKTPDVPPIEEASPEAAAPPPIGDNQPPGPTLDWSAEEWHEHLTTVFAGAYLRKQNLLESFERFKSGFPLDESRDPDKPPAGIEKWSDEIQGRAGDLKDKLAAIVKLSENLHGIEKAPIIVAQRAVDGYQRAFRQALDEATREVNRRRTIYGRYIEARNRRAAEDEAKRKADEAAEASRQAAKTLDPEHLERAAEAIEDAQAAGELAAAKPAEHSRVYGPEGSVSSLRDNWKFIENESDILELAKAVIAGTVPRTYLAFNTSRINLAVKSERIREIPGCVIRNEAEVR